MDNWLQLQRFKRAKKYIRKGDSVLDIGCETGTFFEYIDDLISEGTGIDTVDYEYVPKTKVKTKLFKGYFPDVLESDQKFDVITMLAVLEHIQPEDQTKVAEGVIKHLKKDGRLIITVPDKKVDNIIIALQKFGLVDAATLDEHYGYDINKTESIFSSDDMKMVVWKKFQLGLNNLFVFQKES